jgi:ATP-dependent protease ClpP protease subunit
MEQKTTIIKFVAAVNQQSVGQLLQTVDQKLKEGTKRFILVLSTTGGSVFHGLSAYNYLRGIPAEIVTHNCGQIISVGVVLYCSGTSRLCTPHSTFLIHGVQSNFPKGAALEEKQLEERLKGLQIDTHTIGKVISDHSDKSFEDIKQAMNDRTTLNPEQAIEWGLTDSIEEALYPENPDTILIYN